MKKGVLVLVLILSTLFLISFVSASFWDLFGITGKAITDTNNANLVAYYPFDINANDQSGHANNLGCSSVSTCPGLTTGKISKAYNFDGVNDQYTDSSTSSLDINQYSTSAWIKTSNKQGRMTIVEFTKSSANGNNRRGIAISGNNNLGKPIIYYGNDKMKIGNTGDLRDGNWHHIVVIYDSTDSSMYVDGVSATLGAEDTTNSGSFSSQLKIGNSLTSQENSYFNGTIDDVRIYNKALTSNEVLELYNYEILNCIDTDVNLTYSDGKNYYLLGNTNVTRNGHLWSSNTDQCPTNTKVKEFFCSNGNFNSIDYDCPTDYSCQSGACIKNINGSACTQNSECGSKSNSLVCYTGNIYNQTITPSCSGGSCDSSNITRILNKSCSYGCNPTTVTCLSQTQSQTCLDSDSGTDGFGASAFGLYGKGNVSVLNSTSSTTSYYLDSCSNSTAVLEWFCDSSGDIYNVTYNCPAGCSNEACVSNQNYPDEICDDSDNGKNYTYSGVVDYTLDLIDLSFPDECEQNQVIEYFCSNDNYVDFVKQSCGSTKICSNGKCIPLSNNQTDGNVNVSLECTDGTSSCDGSYYIYCANGQWLDSQQIPGQCDYQSSTLGNNLQGRLDNAGSSAEQGSKWLFYLLIILIILIIIGVISVITFYIIKRKNKSQNTKSPPSKSSTSGPKSPPFPPSSGNSSQMPPVRKGFASLRLPSNIQNPGTKH